MRKKVYLVTGGNGFIGNGVVRRLIKEKHRVRVLDNNLRSGFSRLKDVANKIEIINKDIRDKKAVRKASKGVDCVLHLAYLNGTEFFYKRPELVLDIGVKGITNVIDACLLEGVKELILLSSSEVYHTPPVIPADEKVPLIIPDPINPRYSYGGGKIISELMAINYGRRHFDRVVIARPHNVYGPDMGWEHVIPQFVVRMKGLCGKTKDEIIKFPIQGSGSQTRAFIFIEDFIDGFMLMLEKGEHLGIYNIGTTEEISMEKVALEVARYFKRKAEIVPRKAPEGSTARRCPDISKIKKLGFSPRYSFAEGLKITAKWYDDNAQKKPSASNRRIESEKIRPL